MSKVHVIKESLSQPQVFACYRLLSTSFCPVTQINLDTMRHMVNLETNWTQKIGTLKMALMCAKAFERFSSQNQHQ